MAESLDRVGVTNHRIDPDQLEAGDHIYIHETGGITNKHGMVIWKDNESIYVAYYGNNRLGYEATIILSPLAEFSNGKSIRLYVYGVSKLRNKLARRGSTSIQKCLPSNEVVENILYYCINPQKVPLAICQNKSEAFAKACTSRTEIELVAKNLVYPAIDDSMLRVGFLDHRIQDCKLKPGDHIYVYRKLKFYSHHGIYIGQNRNRVPLVIHFTGDSGIKKAKSTAKIRSTSIAKFLHDGELRLVSYNDLALFKRPGASQTINCLPAHEVVQIAEHYAEHPEEWDDYNSITNNCEHFAIYCKTRKRRHEYAGEIRDQALIFNTVVDHYMMHAKGH